MMSEKKIPETILVKVLSLEISIEKITPINTEIEKLNQNPQYLDTIINKGKDKAISIADSVLNRVYTAVGLKNNQYPQ